MFSVLSETKIGETTVASNEDIKIQKEKSRNKNSTLIIGNLTKELAGSNRNKTNNL